MNNNVLNFVLDQLFKLENAINPPLQNAFYHALCAVRDGVANLKLLLLEAKTRVAQLEEENRIYILGMQSAQESLRLADEKVAYLNQDNEVLLQEIDAHVAEKRELEIKLDAIYLNCVGNKD